MEQYDVKCPICGTINKGLYMKETDGWMVCEHCKNEVQILKYAQTVKIPVFTPQNIKAIVGN